MPTFKLDGQDIPFEPGESIIKAAYRQGIEIPHYCWHPGLSAPANCRMCLIEIKPAANQRPVMLDILEWDPAINDYRSVQKPKLQPACQMAAVEGQEILAETSSHVKKARSQVQESLLLNHPVDCPICDQSGECKLQDYWLEYQHTQKRMRDEPVHKVKGLSFGDTIVYDGERCVMCTRCIRFMDEVAKDPVLDMRERGNLNEIFVAPGRKLEGHYTFMTEHVCPVGALTTKDFRFKARVWFLKSARSVCQGCATGCSAWLDYDPRYNKAYRYRPRDNEQVNKYWMCDEGMLSYKTSHEGRVTEPRIGSKRAKMKSALDEAKKLFSGTSPDLIAVVLSAQHSVEDNWAIRELAKLLGVTAIYATGAAPGYADKILIHADKNSNSAGVLQLVPGVKAFRDLVNDVRAGRVTHVIALGGATPTDEAEDASAMGMVRGIVSIAAHDTGVLTRMAQVTLPAASWAESSGTFVNAKGVRQVADKALQLEGSSAPAWEQIRELAIALGQSPTWTKLKDLRAQLAGGAAPPSSPSMTSGDAPGGATGSAE